MIFQLLHTQQKCGNRCFRRSSSHRPSAALSPDTGGIWEGLWENVTPAELLYIFSSPHASLHLASPLAHTWEQQSLTILSLSTDLMVHWQKLRTNMTININCNRLLNNNLYLDIYWNESKNIQFHFYLLGKNPMRFETIQISPYEMPLCVFIVSDIIICIVGYFSISIMVEAE